MSILVNRFGAALAAGSMMGVASYAYNRAGEQGKLSQKMGFVTPVGNFAKLMSGATAASVLIAPKYSLTLIVGIMGAITLVAVNNSKREIQEARKANEVSKVVLNK